MQKALKQIRDELGDDAIILSNRKLSNGKVEISVSVEQVDYQANGLPAPSNASEEISSELGPTMEPLKISNEKAKQLLAAVRSNQQSKSSSNSEFEFSVTPSATPTALSNQPQSLAAPMNELTQFLQNTMFQMQQEIFELKSQLTVERDSSNPNKTQVKVEPEQKKEVINSIKDDQKSLALVHKRWRQLGLNDQLFHSFCQSNVYINSPKVPEQLWKSSVKYLKSRVSRYCRNALESPGVYAFVGPTGAGKTTTLAKLAVRQVNRWGADNVGIVTMDSFRIGAWEQMQRLGDIIGVKTALCRQEDSLLDTLSNMRDCKFILIDTAGLSYQDERRLAQWKKLEALGDEVETFLVAQANLQASVLQQLTKAYQSAKIRGVIYTKCDEVTSLGEAVSALIQADLPWVFACDGQRIPEDLKVMSVDEVIQMLVVTAKNKRWQLSGHASEQESILIKALG